MLVLSRKVDQGVVIDGVIKVKVVEVSRKYVKLGFEAPDGLVILRDELVGRDGQTGERGADQ